LLLGALKLTLLKMLKNSVEMAKAAAEAGLAVLRQPVGEADSWGDVPDVGVRSAERAPEIMIRSTVEHAGWRIRIPL
jgi:hypothetical protein